MRSYLDADIDEVYVQQIGPDVDGFFASCATCFPSCARESDDEHAVRFVALAELRCSAPSPGPTPAPHMSHSVFRRREAGTQNPKG